MIDVIDTEGIYYKFYTNSDYVFYFYFYELSKPSTYSVSDIPECMYLVHRRRFVLVRSSHRPPHPHFATKPLVQCGH